MIKSGFSLCQEYQELKKFYEKVKKTSEKLMNF